MIVVDKRVLITGAARGIGAQTARQLAAKGARISLVGLEPERLAALAAELGPEHVWFEADVTDQDALNAAAAGTADRLGGIDVVFANAGLGPLGTIGGVDPEAAARAIEVNLGGILRTVHATINSVKDTDGYILLMSSAAALAGIPGFAAYAATKSGVESLARSLRGEVARSGVAVGSAHPCWIETEMVAGPKQELEGFRRMLDALPWPLNTTTSVEQCAEAMVNAIERRARRVYVPRSVALTFALRGLINSRAGEWYLRRRLQPVLDLLDQEIAERGALRGRAAELERERAVSAH